VVASVEVEEEPFEMEEPMMRSHTDKSHSHAPA
jgi:hypothetical protein